MYMKNRQMIDQWFEHCILLCNHLTNKNLVENLTQIQSKVIQIGEKIEELEDECSEVIHCLEELCEYIYQITVDDTNGVLETDYVEHLQKRLEEARTIMDQSIPVRDKLEVVFLPYNASMWDSMDSVCQAAMRDMNADVHVIPIPYMQKKKSGGQASIHDERNQFPADLPLEDYKNYSIKKKRPDIIVTQYPYDGYNTLTDIPKEYYSVELKKYTRHLIYIPYYVLADEIVPLDFMVLPVIRNSWKTFVQSENVRKCYLKYHEPCKIVALGSPKIDKVVNEKKDLSICPDEWKEKIKEKKILLYNTHIINFMNHPTEAIAQIKHMLESFRDNSRYVLLWRPHPYCKIVLKKDKKQYDQYIQLVCEAQKMSGILYDESPNLNRALAIADAYIGEMSSLVTLYSFTKKPVFVLPVVEQNSGHNELVPFASKVIGDELYFLTGLPEDSLWKYDLINKTVTYLDSIEADNREIFQYMGMIFYDGWLWFIPRSADCILKYRIETGEKVKLPIPMLSHNCIQGFFTYYQKENLLYLIPSYLNIFVRIDLDTNEVETFDQWPDGTDCTDERANFTSVFYHNDRLYMIRDDARENVCFDENTKGLERCQAYDSIKGHVVSDGTQIWKVPEQTDDVLCVYDMGGSPMDGNHPMHSNDQNHASDNKITDSSNKMFWNSYVFDDKLWMLPFEADYIGVYDMEAKTYTKIADFPESQQWHNATGSHRFYYAETWKNRIVATARTTNLIVIADKDGNNAEYRKLEMSKDDVLDYIRRRPVHGTSYNLQKKVYDLPTFLKEAELQKCDQNDFKQLAVNGDGSCGSKIWNYIKEELAHE